MSNDVFATNNFSISNDGSASFAGTAFAVTNKKLRKLDGRCFILLMMVL